MSDTRLLPFFVASDTAAVHADGVGQRGLLRTAPVAANLMPLGTMFEGRLIQFGANITF